MKTHMSVGLWQELEGAKPEGELCEESHTDIVMGEEDAGQSSAPAVQGGQAGCH